MLLMVTLVLITGAIGLAALKRLNDQLARTTARQAIASELVDQMLEETRHLADQARRAANAETAELRNLALVDLAVTQERLGKVVDQASSQLQDVPEVRKAIEEGFSSFVISVVKASRLLRAGRIEDAQRELAVQFEPKLLDYLLTTVKAIEQHARMENLSVNEASRRTFQHSQVALALSIAFAILAALLGRMMLHRTVVKPVHRAVAAAEALANGHFEIDLSTRAWDECGEMLHAMDRLRCGLQTVAQAQRDLLAWDAQETVELERQNIAQLPGAYGELIAAVAQAMHRSRSNYHTMRRELLTVTAAIGRGDFSRKLEATGDEGMWHELAQMLNQLTDRLGSVLESVSRQLAELSQGNLGWNIEGRHEGLLGEVVKSLADTIGDLSAIVTAIRTSADSVSVEAKHSAARNAALSKQTEQQATGLEESATAVSRLANTARETARHAEETHRLMEAASKAAIRGNELTGHVTSTMESIQSVSQQIGAIVELINSVAFQTNILALNAAVEAAHAGAHGKGFAVVADEVRSLASRTAAAARDIETLVQDTKTKVEAGVGWVGQAGQSMQAIAHDVTTAAAMIGEINRANQAQSRDIDAVNDTIGRLRDDTGQTASLVENATAAAHKLADEAATLLKSVAVFKLAAHADDSGFTKKHG
jgi:methyl-accepting chemotaxis protein